MLILFSVLFCARDEIISIPGENIPECEASQECGHIREFKE